MPDLFRGMLKDSTTNGPVTGNDSGNKLGVRPADVVTYDHGGVPWVAPTYQGHSQGMSVSPNNGCNLPAHRRPSGSNWNGTGSVNLKVWRIASSALPVTLQYLADPASATHGYVAPAADIAFATYQVNVQNTAALWVEVAPPLQPCAALSVSSKGGLAMVSPSLKRKIESAVKANAPDILAKQILEENRNGISEAAIIAAVEAEIVHLEATSRDDEVEMLRSILDRITGFCGAHLRLRLK